eukprot:NODE_3612_length_537_cov_75.278689_g3066_i0.p1 GENE.NODE_3612_length_537_cov_75.278689_g3066_i0~~NODE_3612_length_537_cov_75.278689_g3066_i0.p1  ORF type:complete len:129 (-),score=15.84 NODE_3612_length_537_cov_75.278689_g3066_i0:76-462(-)
MISILILHLVLILSILIPIPIAIHQKSADNSKPTPESGIHAFVHHSCGAVYLHSTYPIPLMVQCLVHMSNAPSSCPTSTPYGATGNINTAYWRTYHTTVMCPTSDKKSATAAQWISMPLFLYTACSSH